MAAERTVECPECGRARTIRAQPNTRLRCPGCSAHFLAPPIEPDPLPDDPPDDSGELPVHPAGADLGPDTVHIDGVAFRPAPIAPQGVQPRGAQQSKSDRNSDRQKSQDLDDLDLADPPGSSDPDDPPTNRAQSGSSAAAEGEGETSQPPTPAAPKAKTRRRRYGRW